MSEKPKKETYFVVIRESVMESWARDASVFAMFFGLIGIGVYLQSSAMQWVGALCGFIVIMARASGRKKELTKAEAIKFIQEMGE